MAQAWERAVEAMERVASVMEKVAGRLDMVVNALSSMAGALPVRGAMSLLEPNVSAPPPIAMGEPHAVREQMPKAEPGHGEAPPPIRMDEPHAVREQMPGAQPIAPSPTAVLAGAQPVMGVQQQQVKPPVVLTIDDNVTREKIEAMNILQVRALMLRYAHEIVQSSARGPVVLSQATQGKVETMMQRARALIGVTEKETGRRFTMPPEAVLLQSAILRAAHPDTEVVRKLGYTLAVPAGVKAEDIGQFFARSVGEHHGIMAPEMNLPNPKKPADEVKF
ncbi:MAG: hypothetical protein ONB06_09825 [candidate division KSB1 bacterium]|nr:hypothetical protein [candidate division KSB1 bacterium]